MTDASDQPVTEHFISSAFLSYAREDLATAQKLKRDLSLRGFKIWADFEDLQPGQKWRFEITKAIRECDFFIALLSKSAITKKGYVQKEIREALEIVELVPPGSIYLLPVRADDSEPAHPSLVDLQWVDLFPSYKHSLGKIVRALSGGAAKSMALYCQLYVEGFIEGKPICHRVGHTPFRIGRNPNNDLVISSPEISGKHAEIISRSGAFFISDQDSTNGTRLNDSEVVDDEELSPEDLIVFGEVRLRITNEPLLKQLYLGTHQTTVDHVVSLSFPRSAKYQLDTSVVLKLARLLRYSEPQVIVDQHTSYLLKGDTEDVEKEFGSPTLHGLPKMS